MSGRPQPAMLAGTPAALRRRPPGLGQEDAAVSTKLDLHLES